MAAPPPAAAEREKVSRERERVIEASERGRNAPGRGCRKTLLKKCVKESAEIEVIF